MIRFFDLIFSIFILLLFLPIGIVIAILIRIESKGSVFYSQVRIGKDEKQFKLLKFRSMLVNADKQGNLTVGAKDSRITRVGYVIRKFKLDEFPQFINVLLGQMSVVGPRPEVLEFVALYTAQQRKVLLVRPGITDEASLQYFEENKLLAGSEDPKKTYIDVVMPSKIAINLAYLENRTLLTDLTVVGKTILRIFRA
jgi:lipopolysaccharide/colanic/teichoic acid biosynthesis glycosyltransferase